MSVHTCLESVNKSPHLHSASASVFIVWQSGKLIFFQYLIQLKIILCRKHKYHNSSCSKRTVKSRLWSCDIWKLKAALCSPVATDTSGWYLLPFKPVTPSCNLHMLSSPRRRRKAGHLTPHKMSTVLLSSSAKILSITMAKVTGEWNHLYWN